MDRQRVAFVTPGSFPVPGTGSSSVEHAVAEMARELARYVDVDVYGRTSPKQPRTELREGVRYTRVPVRSRNGYAAEVVKKLRKRSFRVIQVENRPRLAWYIKRRLPGTQVWLFLHSVTFINLKRIGAVRLRRWMRAPDRVLVNSQYLLEEVLARFPELEGRVYVNHLGVNPEQFASRWTEEGEVWRQKRLAQLGLSGRRVVLYVGRLIPLKGVHHAVSAMAEVSARCPEAVLVLVGGAFYGSRRETPYVRRLKRMARRQAGQVRFVPFVPHNRVHEWFRLADAAVVPTPEREAFGLVNVEAMATGLPVVACASGGLPEVVTHGETGFLVPPTELTSALSERIVSILEDPTLQRRLGEGGLERVRQYFAWEHAAVRWLELLP